MKTKNETTHYQRFYNSDEAYCGVKLHDGPGTVMLRGSTIFRNQVTCKNCRSKIKKDAV